MSKPDWSAVYFDAYLGVRDQLRAERAAGVRRYDLRSTSDGALDSYARRAAEKRVQEAINRWNEKH